MSSQKSKLPAAIGLSLSIIVLCIALWFLHRELAGLSFATILEQVRSIPVAALIVAAVLAASSYLLMTSIDGMALRHIGRAMPYRKFGLTAFIATAVGNNVGIATLSGGSIRYRMYTLGGLSATEIARIIVFVSVTFILGVSGLLGTALLAMPALESQILPLPRSLILLISIALIALPIAYLTASFVKKDPISFRNWELVLPSPRIAIGQIVVSIVDIGLVAATLYVLLEPTIQIAFIPFLGVFLLALTVGLISSVPGGIGVFEAVMVAALPNIAPSELLGTMIVYRLVYYVFPLIVSLLILLAHEAHHHQRVLQQSSERIGDWLSAIAPQLIGAFVFLGGVVLLISGASPGVESRIQLIAEVLPLPLLEASHLAGSVIGVTLLVLARGLYRRLRGAWFATLIALALGVLLSLLKGLDYEEASILGVVMVLLWVSRDEFHRVGSVASQRFSGQWVVAILLVLCIGAWVSIISYRDVPYSDELWWRFAFDQAAPRTLRAGILAAVTALAFAVWKLLQAGPRRMPLPETLDDVERIRHVLTKATDASANVALLGDKRFLWSEDNQAFIMYQVSGDSWIALGNPVGPANYHEELIWKYRELVDRFGGRPVFYQVSDQSLPLYIDLGLSFAKLGEDGRVPLSGFSLQGSHRADLRQAVNRSRKQGAEFEIVPRSAVPGIAAKLHEISDSWLADKAAAEKGFSLGSFSETYIQNFDCAVVRVQGNIVAFTNLWPAPAGGELSVDLMRYNDQAPKSIMDYLFAELMLWAARNGYAWFSLGMAPLSGLEQRSLAPLWHKLGHLIYTHGESFYNFEGLRAYKEKFEPEWRPQYLACPGGWFDLPWALVDSSRLISGGLTHVIMK